METKLKVNKMYNDIVECFKNANNNVIKECKMRPKSKRQNWWTKELENIKNVIKEARKDYKVNNNVS